MRELLDKRSFTAKHFELENGLYLMKAHIGHIHYRDGALKDGEFLDIDTVLDYNAKSESFQMTKASYEAEIGLYGDVTFHDVDHSLEFRLPNPNKIEGVPYDGSAFGKLGKALIWKDIIQDGGHQIVEARNGSLAKIFHFDQPPKSNVIWFQVITSEGVKFSDGGADFDLDRDAKCELVDSQGEFRSSGKVSFIHQPRVWNHRGESTNIKLQFVQLGTETWALKIIPQDFIDKTFTEAGAWLECDTTTSYYAGSTDGNFLRGGVDETFSTIRSGAQTSSAQGGTTGNAYWLGSSSTTNQYVNFHRAAFPINTSGIGAGMQVTDVHLFFWLFSFSNTFSTAPSLSIDNVTGSLAYEIANYEGVKKATDILQTNLLDSQYNDIVLNAAGRAAVNITGTTTFATRHSWDMDNTPPTWGDAQAAKISVAFSEYTGTDHDPYITVTYIVAPPIFLTPPLALLRNAVYRM
jgi:hypothetical protein